MTKPLHQLACHARHERAGIVTRGSAPCEWVLTFSFPLKFPLNSPPGVSSEKNNKSNKDGQAVTSSCDYSAKEMLRSASFYLIWLVFLIGTGGGLMVISQASPFGQNIVELSPIIAGSVIMVMGFSYGGFLGTMPSITADYYGLKNVGLNYAWVYTGWGAAGYFGPQVALKYW